MKETNLEGAKMEGAILRGALLIRANLTASDVTTFQYERARTLEGTILPNGSVHE